MVIRKWDLPSVLHIEKTNISSFSIWGAWVQMNMEFLVQVFDFVEGTEVWKLSPPVNLLSVGGGVEGRVRWKEPCGVYDLSFLILELEFLKGNEWKLFHWES